MHHAIYKTNLPKKGSVPFVITSSATPVLPPLAPSSEWQGLHSVLSSSGSVAVSTVDVLTGVWIVRSSSMARNSRSVIVSMSRDLLLSWNQHIIIIIFLIPNKQVDFLELQGPKSFVSPIASLILTQNKI